MAKIPGMGEGPDHERVAETDRPVPSERRSRALAIVAMTAGALLVLLIVAFVLRNGVAIALGLVGLVMGIAGGWWVITEHSLRRVIGYLGVAIGMALMVVALLRAGQENWASARACGTCPGLALRCDRLRAGIACLQAAGIANRQRPPSSATQSPGSAL